LSNTGYVYAIGMEGSPLIKIGWARSPEKRLAQLQTGQPYQLELLYQLLTEQPRRVEGCLHRMLGDRYRGEWFERPERALPEVFLEAAEHARSRVYLKRPRRRSSLSPYDYSERVKRALGYRNRAVSDASQAIGLSVHGLMPLVNGMVSDPKAGVLRALAVELDVSADYLMGLSDVMERR
jgi:hypothetical protein